MNFKYLGTAAAEGVPGLFCSCDCCKKALAAGGKNIRTRSQAVIDGRLLIDFPADTYMHVVTLGLDLTKIKSLIVTHCHSDHLYPADFEMRETGFAHLETESCLTVYGTAPTETMCRDILKLYRLDLGSRVAFETIKAFVPFRTDGYSVVPLKAEHDNILDPVIFLISDGIKTILYANDTGYFPDSTWDYLKKYGRPLDFVSLDCTKGTGKFDFNSHMSLEENAAVKKRLLEIGCADGHTVFCTNHFSHNGAPIYDEMVPIARQSGFLVSYDGLSIDI